MNKKIIISLCFIIAMVTTNKLFSQNNHTITYAGSNLNPLTNCNVFAESANTSVGGLVHWPVSGGDLFDGTNIKMKTTYDGSTDNGTAYGIAYPFLTMHNYAITITLSVATSPAGIYPEIDASLWQSLPDPNSTDPTGCGPVSQSYYSSSIGYRVGVIFPTQTASNTYNLISPTNSFSVANAQNYLVITAWHGASAGSTVSISKITITETTATTPPAPPDCNGITQINTGVIPTGKTKNGTIYIGSTAGTGGYGTVTINSTATTTLIAVNKIDFVTSFHATVSSGLFSAKLVTCANLPLAFSPTRNNIFTDDKVNVYPSPSKGLIKITGNTLDLVNSKIIVTDQSGRFVNKFFNNSNSNIIELDLHNLSSGIYYVKIYMLDKIVTKKIMIAK